MNGKCNFHYIILFIAMKVNACYQKAETKILHQTSVQVVPLIVIPLIFMIHKIDVLQINSNKSHIFTLLF